MAESRQKRRVWTQEEDNKLKECRCKNPDRSWSAIAKLAGLDRDGKSCWERWNNHHDRSLKKGNFCPEEDDTIIDLQRNYGNKWAWIASYLRRTKSDVKNRWHNHLMKKVRRSTGENIRDPQSSIRDQPHATQLFHLKHNIDPNASSSLIPAPVSSSQEIVNHETIHHSLGGNYYSFGGTDFELEPRIPEAKSEFMSIEEVIELIMEPKHND